MKTSVFWHKFWVGFSVLSCLVWFWTLKRIIDPSSPCHDSGTVERVIFESFGRPTEAPACSIWQKLFANRNADSLTISTLQEINRIAASQKELEQFLGPIPRGLNVIVNSDSPFTLRYQSQILEMGSEVASRDGQIIKNVFAVWLREGILRINDPFVLEVASEFLKTLITQKLSLSRLQWIDTQLTDQEFCQSSDFSYFARNMCGSQFTGKAPSLWAVAPFVSQSLWEEFQTRDFGERSQVLKAWINEFHGLASNPKIFKNALNGETLSYFGWTKNLLAHFLRPDQIERLKPTQGFSESIELPLVIDVKNLAIDLGSVAGFFKDLPKNPTVVLGKDNYFRLPYRDCADCNHSWTLTRQTLGIDRLKAQRWVWIGCNLPTLEQVSRYETEKLTLIKYCPGQGPLNLESPISKSFSTFYELHVPSLRLALRLSPSYKNVALSSMSQSDMSRVFHWRDKPAFDKIYSIYKPLGDIDGITAFR